MSVTYETLNPLFRMIRQRFSSLPVFSVSWIYLNNARHSAQKEIEQVKILPTLLSIFLRIGWLLFRGIFLSLRVVWIGLFLYRPLLKLKAMTFDGLAKSWTFSLNPTKEDFYLGDLADRLKEKNVRLLMLCGNATGGHWFRFLNKNISTTFPFQCPEFGLLKPFDIFLMIAKQYIASFYLLFQFLGEKKHQMRSALLLLSRDVLRYQTLTNGLYYWIGKRAFHYWKPKFFITLYEGNAWEKCLWMGLKEGDSSCCLVGYQHTVILRRTVEMREPSTVFGALPVIPDVILNTGSKPLEMMKPGYQRFKTRFLEFGSFRFQTPESGVRKPSTQKKTILVVPEGILSEMVCLFDIALILAKRRPDYQMRLRCHPVMSFERVRPFLKENIHAVSNVQLSTEVSMEQDFASSGAVLYRGSSTVLYAILAGLKPICYFQQGDDEGIDPLFELKAWREQVCSVEDLERVLDGYFDQSQSEAETEWEQASDYARNYVRPVMDQSINQLLEYVL